MQRKSFYLGELGLQWFTQFQYTLKYLFFVPYYIYNKLQVKLLLGEGGAIS